MTRQAGPPLGSAAGTVNGYTYSTALTGNDLVCNDDTINALFDVRPDELIPGSTTPVQRITDAQDRIDLVEYLKRATDPDASGADTAIQHDQIEAE